MSKFPGPFPHEKVYPLLLSQSLRSIPPFKVQIPSLFMGENALGGMDWEFWTLVGEIDVGKWTFSWGEGGNGPGQFEQK